MSTKIKSKKKKPSVNQYDLLQFKKMVGKGLVMLCKNIAAVNDPTLRDKIISKAAKSVAMTGFVKGGVLYIYEGIDRLLAVNSISYADIKKHGIELDIIINQYVGVSYKDLIS